MSEILLYALEQFLFALVFITCVYLVSKEILDFLRGEG